MLADLIYNHSVGLVAAVIVVLFVAIACAGLVLIHRLVPVRLRHSHNEMVGFSVAIVGVVYAVLLAFIAVTTWERNRKADTAVATEASYVGDVYRNTLGFPESLTQQLRPHLQEYVEVVTKQEWPAQRSGRFKEEAWQLGWKALADLHYDIARFRPADAGEANLQAQFLRSLNGLYDARRSRLLATEEHVTAVVWWIIALGAALTVGFTFLFGTPQFRMHLVITGIVAASLAIVIVLIVALDHPFRGALGVSDDAFRVVRENMQVLTFEHR